MLAEATFCLAFAAIGYSHGDQYFDKNLPTNVNRITSVTAMAALAMGVQMWQNLPGSQIIISLCWLLVSLAIWIWFGEMTEITAAIGGDDGKGSLSSRLIGTGELTIREALILPAIAGACYINHASYWPLTGILFMGIPYLLFGYLFPQTIQKLRNYVVLVPHAFKFAVVGAMIWSILC